MDASKMIRKNLNDKGLSYKDELPYFGKKNNPWA